MKITFVTCNGTFYTHLMYPSAVLDKDEDEETEESLGEITTVTTFPEVNHKDDISDSSNEEEVNEEVSANLLEELDHDTTTIESVNSSTAADTTTVSAATAVEIELTSSLPLCATTDLDCLRGMLARTARLLGVRLQRTQQEVVGCMENSVETHVFLTSDEKRVEIIKGFSRRICHSLQKFS